MKINDSLGFNLGVTNKKLKHSLMDLLKKYELTTAQWVVLKLLCEQGNMAQAEIAHNLKSDKMTVGSIVEKLLLKNLVERKKSEIDKRSYDICISNKGSKQVLDMEEDVDKINKQALLGFTEEETKLFISYLDRVRRNFEE